MNAVLLKLHLSHYSFEPSQHGQKEEGFLSHTEPFEKCSSMGLASGNYLSKSTWNSLILKCSKKCPSSQSGSATNLQINTIRRECVLEILGPWVKLLNRAACDLQPPQQAKTTQLAKTRRLSTHWGRWAQHAADYSKGLFYYPEPSELWAKLGNKIPNASQTKIQRRGFIQGCYGVNQHVGRVVTTALPLNHFHWFIGHDIVIRNLLHLFPGHILVSQFESSKLPWHPQIYNNILTVCWNFIDTSTQCTKTRHFAHHFHLTNLAEIAAELHLKADWRVPLPLLSWAMRAFRPILTSKLIWMIDPSKYSIHVLSEECAV